MNEINYYYAIWISPKVKNQMFTWFDLIICSTEISCGVLFLAGVSSYSSYLQFGFSSTD